jgi:hypothetical protein
VAWATGIRRTSQRPVPTVELRPKALCGIRLDGERRSLMTLRPSRTRPAKTRVADIKACPTMPE